MSATNILCERPVRVSGDLSASQPLVMEGFVLPGLRGGRTWIFPMLAVTGVALGISSYLAWATIQLGTIPGCEADQYFSCDHVMHSNWSKWLGIPVSIPGGATYALALVSLMGLSMSRSATAAARWASILVFCSITAVLAGVWFTALQLVAIGKLCQWCLTVHSMGLLLFGMICAARWVSAKRFLQLGGMGLAAMAMLVAGQWWNPPAQTFEVVVFDHADGDPAASAPADVLEAPADVLDAPVDVLDAPVDSLVGVLDAPVQDEVPATDNSQLANRDPLPTADVPKTVTEVPVPEVPQVVPASAETSMEIIAPSETDVAAYPTPTQTPLPEDEGGEVRDEDPQPEAAAQPARRIVRLGAQPNSPPLNVYNRPILGSVDAPIVFVELFDYTCPHCRQLNRQLQEVRRRFGKDLAVVVLPVPLSRECNPSVTTDNPSHHDACEISRLAIAVWKLDSQAFVGYHEWLSQPENGRTASEARLQAEQIVDREQLREALAGSLVSQFIGQHAQIYQLIGKGILPRLYSERMGITGQLGSAQELIDRIAAGHGIRPSAQ